MRAALVTEFPATVLEVTNVAEPEPKAVDELLIAVKACGICGTDLHIIEGHSYRPALPFVLGHEPVGTVIAAGAAVREWLGREVTITLFRGCGACALCLSGNERLCAELVSITGVLESWGGFAERVLVRAAQAVDIPEGLPPNEAAVLVDSGATAMNAVHVALEHGGERFVVVGGGPVGFLVAERLRVARKALRVVEPHARRREALALLGHEVGGSLDVGAAPDVVLDCAGAPDVLSWALESLAPRGLYVAVGYGLVPAVDLSPLARKELTMRGVRSGSNSDLKEALELAASGEIRLPAVSTWSIEDINDAFRALRAGEVEGKAVIVFAEGRETQPWTS